MQRLTIITTFLTISILIACDRHENTSSAGDKPETSVAQTKTVYYYSCPMDEHKHVYNDKPGECPECRQDLATVVAAPTDSVEFYGCPIINHSHVRQDNPGKCEECNMELKPMCMATNS